MTTQTSQDLRAKMTDVLLALDFIDRFPEVFDDCLVYFGEDRVQVQIGFDGDPAERLGRIASTLAIGAPFASVRKEFEGNYAKVIRDFGATAIEAWATRDRVCERVVTGTEMVEIADPDAPKLQVEREIVEWVCSPLLGASVES